MLLDGDPYLISKSVSSLNLPKIYEYFLAVAQPKRHDIPADEALMHRCSV